MIKILPIFTAILMFLGITNGTNPSASHVNTVSNTTIGSTKPVAIRPIEPQTVNAQEKPEEFSPPTLLTIPKIGLTANIISVGLDSQGRMDVPNNFVEVGWYNLGYMPGEIGSAVLDGHQDDFQGNPAVFYNLKHLEIGDEIFVTDQSGKQYTYVVSDNIVYPVDAVPLQEVFNSNDKARLNLITCYGTWDDSIQTYNERTVIYSELQI